MLMGMHLADGTSHRSCFIALSAAVITTVTLFVALRPPPAERDELVRYRCPAHHHHHR
jgi:hypothetical protein